MIAAAQPLDVRTSQFLDSSIKIDGKDVQIRKLAELVGITPDAISQELSLISQSSTEPTPNIRRLGLYAGLAQRELSILGAKSTSITINLSEPLKVDFVFDSTQTLSSGGQEQSISIDVEASKAKELGIETKTVKLLRSSITVLDKNGRIETTYTAFNASDDTLKCLRTLCDQTVSSNHKYVLLDLPDLICEGATIITHARRSNSDPVVVYLQRN